MGREVLKFITNDLPIILISVFLLFATGCSQASESAGSAGEPDKKTESISLKSENVEQDAEKLRLTVESDPKPSYKTNPFDTPETTTVPPRPTFIPIAIGKAAVLEKENGDFEHPVCGALKSALLNFPKDENLIGRRGIRLEPLIDAIRSEAVTAKSDPSIVDWQEVPEAERDTLFFQLRYAKAGKLDVDVRPKRYRFYDEPKIWTDRDRGYLTSDEYVTSETGKHSAYADELKNGNIRVEQYELGNGHVLFNAADESGTLGRDPDYVGYSYAYQNSTSHIRPILAVKRAASSGPKYVKLTNLTLNRNSSSPHLTFLAFTHADKVQIMSLSYGYDMRMNVFEYDPATFISLEDWISNQIEPRIFGAIQYAGRHEFLCSVSVDRKKDWVPPEIELVKPKPTPPKPDFPPPVPCISPEYCNPKWEGILQDCRTGDSCSRAGYILSKYRNTGRPTSFTNLMGLSDVKALDVELGPSPNRFVQRLDRTVPPQYINLIRRGRSPDSDMCKSLEARLSPNLSELVRIGQWEVPSYKDPMEYKSDFDLRWVTWLDSSRLKTILGSLFPYEPVVWENVPREEAAQWEYDLLYPNRRMTGLYSPSGYEQPPEKPTTARPELGAETTQAYEYFRYVDIPVGEDADIKKDRPTYRLFKYKYKSDASKPISPHMPYPDTPEYDHLKTTYVAMYGSTQIMPPSMPKYPVLELKKEDRIFFVAPSEAMKEPDVLSSISIKYFNPRKTPDEETKIPHRWRSLGPVLESAYCRIDLKFSAK